MIGTYIIAVIGYGLALMIASEFAICVGRALFPQWLKPKPDNGQVILVSGICTILVAAFTRWLLDGAL